MPFVGLQTVENDFSEAVPGNAWACFSRKRLMRRTVLETALIRRAVTLKQQPSQVLGDREGSFLINLADPEGWIYYSHSDVILAKLSKRGRLNLALSIWWSRTYGWIPAHEFTDNLI